MAHVKTLTHGQLAAMVSGFPGAVAVGLETATDARCRKTGNPYGKVLKICRGVAFTGADYASAVIREGSRQGLAASCQAESLPWGEWLVPGKVISNKGKLYLRIQFTPGQRRVRQMRVVRYLAGNGLAVSFHDIKDFLPPVKESNRQQAAGLGETIQVRTIAFDSIRKMRIGGVTYKITP